MLHHNKTDFNSNLTLEKWIHAKYLINKMKGNKHMIISLDQVILFDSLYLWQNRSSDQG